MEGIIHPIEEQEECFEAKGNSNRICVDFIVK